MAASSVPAIFIFILASFVPLYPSEDILGKKNDEFDFDGLPGAMHEFKIEVGAGVEECFYQKIRKGASFHVSFEVLRGADRNIDCVIKKPDGAVLQSHLWTSDGSTEKDIDMEGVYTLCLDNTFSRFSPKLVYLYMVTYVAEEWENYTKELEQLHISVENFTTSIQKVDKAVNDMMRHQAINRQHVITDWYIISGNNYYVQKYSIIMCFIVMATSGFQTFFVRRLFNTKSVTPTAKPRA